MYTYARITCICVSVLSVILLLPLSAQTRHSLDYDQVSGAALGYSSNEIRHGEDGYPHPCDIDGRVRAIVPYAGNLVVAGEFSQAGAIPANNIALWTGSEWLSMMNGVNGRVWCLCVFNDDLYVGGEFTLAGRIPASYIARWNGDSWSRVADGVDGHVRAMIVFKDRLTVGGDFTTVGDVAATCIAEFDGYEWNPMGDGFCGGYNGYGVRALTVYEDQLIAGGFFQYSGSSYVGYIAEWNGADWSPVGTWEHDAVYSLHVYSGNIIAGTVIWDAGEWQDLILRWDCSEWIPLSNGSLDPPFPNAVRTITTYNGRLFIGGQFKRAGGELVNYIAQWVGRWGPHAHWASLETGMNHNVFALAVHDGKLFAGGGFTSAGDEEVSRIAYWDGNSWNDLDTMVCMGNDETAKSGKQNISLFRSSEDIGIRLTFDMATYVEVSMYNIRGQRVKSLMSGTVPKGEFSLVWDGTNDHGNHMSSGIYFYHIVSDCNPSHAGVVILH